MKELVFIIFCIVHCNNVFIKLNSGNNRCFFEDFYSEAVFNFEYEILDNNIDKNNAKIPDQSDIPFFKVVIRNTQDFDIPNVSDQIEKNITLEAKRKKGTLSTRIADLYFAEYCISTENKEYFSNKEIIISFRVYSTSTIVYGGKSDDIAEEKHMERSNLLIGEIDAHSHELNNIQAVLFENERNFKDNNNDDNYFMIYITTLQVIVISFFGALQLYYIYRMVCIKM